jgi:hypothetical protein
VKKTRDELKSESLALVTAFKEHPELEEIYDTMVMPVDTDIDLSKVILSTRNKELILQFIIETKNREKLERFGLHPMNRILMFGDSGTGKTYLTKALTNALGYQMLYVDIARAIASGNPAKNIADIFTIAEYGDFVIFLDEADSIAWSRDADDAEGGDIRRATNTIFQHMDQMSSRIIVVAATNMVNRLDPAFRRRFNLELRFERPEKNFKEIVSRFLFPGFTLDLDMDDQITERRLKMSYAQIQESVERVMKKAILNDTMIIKMSDIYKDIARVTGVKIKGLNIEEEFYN